MGGTGRHIGYSAIKAASTKYSRSWQQNSFRLHRARLTSDFGPNQSLTKTHGRTQLDCRRTEWLSESSKFKFSVEICKNKTLPCVMPEKEHEF